MRWKAIIFSSHFDKEDNTEKYEINDEITPEKNLNSVIFRIHSKRSLKKI